MSNDEGCEMEKFVVTFQVRMLYSVEVEAPDASSAAARAKDTMGSLHNLGIKVGQIDDYEVEQVPD